MINADLDVIREKGLSLLVEGLGAVGTVNFLKQFDRGSGNYTEDRMSLQEGLSINKIAERIRRRKAAEGRGALFPWGEFRREEEEK